MHIYDWTIDLRNPNHGLLTINHCPTLISLEKEGTGREKLICQDMEPKIMGIHGAFLQPGNTGDPAESAPRTDYQDCCCQWEFKLDR